MQVWCAALEPALQTHRTVAPLPLVTRARHRCRWESNRHLVPKAKFCVSACVEAVTKPPWPRCSC